MAARALIVIWTLASELSTPGTVAMTNATHDALGPDSEVRAEPTPEDEGLRRQAASKVSGVVRVTWDEAEHRRVRLLCYLPALDRWVEREVVFSSSDPELERGRTLGFLVASIFIDAGVLAPPVEPEPEPARPTPAVRPVPPPRAAGKAVASEPRARSSLGAAAQLAGPGTATGFGAWVGLERSLGGPSLWLGGAGQARFGSVPEAQASSRFLALGLQATWLFWMPTPEAWLGVRGSSSLAELAIAHLSEDDAGEPERQSRILSAFELVLHTGYHFSTASALSGDLGAEFLSGKTEIFVSQRRVATWPHVVPVLRLGVKSSF